MDLIFPGAIYPEQVEGLSWWPLLLVGAALIVINIVNNRVAPQTHYLLWAFVGSVVLLAIGLLDGNDFTDMGLGFSYLFPGLIWASASIAGAASSGAATSTAAIAVALNPLTNGRWITSNHSFNTVSGHEKLDGYTIRLSQGKSDFLRNKMLDLRARV